MLNVKDISDQELDGFSARLAAFICAMKYIWNPEGSRDTFRKVLERIRPNYKTVGDALREQEEADKKAAREAGERIGREEGSKQQAENTARRMLAKNKPLTEIVEFTGLSEEQVKKLAASKS